MKKNIVLLIALLISSLLFIVPVQATNDDDNGTTITVYVVSDGNVSSTFNVTTEGDLTAFFNGEANGSINYWIDGMNVKSEFNNVYNLIKDLKNGLFNTHSIASYAYNKALKNYEELQEHDKTLMIYYDAINDTYTKLYLLKDEVVAFEGDYLGFKNLTNNTLNIFGSNLQSQGEDINVLKAKVHDLQGTILLIRNTLIGLFLLAGALFLVNRRYPLGEIMKNGNILSRNGKQYKIVDFVQETKPVIVETNKTEGSLKDRIARIRRMRIRRNPERSPLKLIARIRKNPEKSLLRILFPFLFVNK
ncbi:MAG: hypothetical protein DRN24_03020 [Thermoplasmata archaeon]|nr:MAG: hypothetical protein DRN24_03020 [Thermoplasmata archaeon]